MYIGRMRGALYPVVITILVALLTACGDGLFSSLDEAEQAEVETVVSGSFVVPETEVPLNLVYSRDQEQTATAMTVTIRSSLGEVLHEVEYDSPVLSTRRIPALQLPDLPEGVYFLHIRAWRDGFVLVDEERQFFVTLRPPEIRSLSVYPSRLTQRSESIAIADVISDPGHRPYIRWSIAGQTAAEGYLENGLERAVFAGGRRPGVYAIEMQVFPWGPDEGVRVAAGTAITQASDLVVRAVDDESREEPVHNGALLHYDFAGRLHPVVNRLDRVPPDSTTDEEGTRQERQEPPDYAIATSGTTQLDVVAGNLGYRLDGQRAMTVPVSAFPATETGPLQLELRYLVTADGPGVLFRMVADEEGIASLVLRRDEEADTYIVRFGEEEVSFTTSPSGTVMDIVVVTALRETTVVAIVRVNGTTEAQLEVSLGDERKDAEEHEKEPILAKPGRIVLGGEDSASILVTSLVIRDAPDEIVSAFDSTD
jgi:hypothetical protein